MLHDLLSACFSLLILFLLQECFLLSFFVSFLLARKILFYPVIPRGGVTTTCTSPTSQHFTFGWVPSKGFGTGGLHVSVLLSLHGQHPACRLCIVGAH